ncbi:small multi-drug export protein [Candidatus Uhrbacteria bacterium]|nr:small multi-drug export protein [Candidatus Uhrbacteria bacterium]
MFFEWLNNLPHELGTVVIAMTPILELRASIPIALGVYKMSIPSAIFFSAIGDMIPAVIILRYAGVISELMSKHSRFFDNAMKWWAKRTEKKFLDGFAKYGLAALFIFVAVPLPGTGSWSGALAAFLFRLPFLPSLLAIAAGVFVAAFIVAGASAGALAIF